MLRRSSQIEAAGSAISVTLLNWLKTEVATSAIDNQYLDDFDEMRHRLTLGYDDQDNWAVKKNDSHMDRLPRYWEVYSQDPTDDQLAATISFCGLMFVSGTYRDQCIVQAKNAADYEKSRKAAIGVNLGATVLGQLDLWLPPSAEFAKATIDIDSLKQSMDTAGETGDDAIKEMADRLEDHFDFGEKDSPTIRKLKNAQRYWLRFVVDSVIFNANVRGKLAAVPILEPRTINKAALQKPFADKV